MSSMSEPRPSDEEAVVPAEPEVLLKLRHLEAADHTAAEERSEQEPVQVPGVVRQQIEVGPMSGESNVVYWLEHHGIEPSPERVQAVFQRAKSVDRVLEDGEIRAVLASLDETRV